MNDDKYSPVKPEPIKGAMPTVFMFQPTAVRRLSTPEQLKQWEADLRDKVGFKAAFSHMAASATECCCPHTDDCDQ